MERKIKLWMVIMLSIFFIIFPIVFAITGTSGSITADGQINAIALNGTNTYETRGVGDYISGQFQYPSLDDILIRGRFSILKVNNTAPNAPIIQAPVNDTYQNSTSTTFSWTNTTDPDQDIVSYRLEIFNDSALTLENTINNSIVETATPTETVATLAPDGIYYWRVLANDSSKNSSFTDLRVITIDTTPPTAFNLTSPADATSTQDSSPTLEWDATVDTNLENYTIELSLNSDFSIINATENSSTNSFSDWSNVLAPETYYWRVSAVDKANNQQLSENNLSFTIAVVSQTVTQGGGTISVAGGTSPKPYSFKIIAPPSITIFQDESIIIPLKIQNIGKSINLNNIDLSTRVDSPGVTARLDRILINTLKPESDVVVNLELKATGTAPDSFSVDVLAEVSTPRLQDSVKIITSIAGREDQGKKSSQQLVFTKKFFDGNPQCKELLTEIEMAEQEIERRNHEQAVSILESAVNKCKDLISIKATKKPGLIDLTFNAIKENKTTAIISSQLLALLIIISLIFKKVIKKKTKEIKLDF